MIINRLIFGLKHPPGGEVSLEKVIATRKIAIAIER
jgi:hypothetical protein